MKTSGWYCLECDGVVIGKVIQASEKPEDTDPRFGVARGYVGKYEVKPAYVQVDGKEVVVD